MNTSAPLTPRLHPLMATAAVAVTTFSLAGIAAMSGLLPLTKAATPETVAVPPTVVQPAASVATATSAVPASGHFIPPAPTFATPAVKPKPAVEKKAAKPAVVTPVASTDRNEMVESPPVSADSAPLPTTPVTPVAPVTPTVTQAAATPAHAPACTQCGIVDNVREVSQPGEGSGLGAVLGGVLGGVIGNQVGGGSGNKIATVLGAAGGAYAGHQYEKNRNQTTRYEISVRMPDGSLRSVTQDSVPAWRIGDRVRIDNNVLVAN